MRILLFLLFVSISFQSHADNIADCEVVVMEKYKPEDNKQIMEVASFHPAINFIESIYNEDKEIIRTINGFKIRALMCRRMNVIPKRIDYPILKSGIPLILSQNFDSSTSGITKIYFKNRKFNYTYSGPNLSDRDIEKMKINLNFFNSQSHDFSEKEKNK
jgi:hypothetical protein